MPKKPLLLFDRAPDFCVMLTAALGQQFSVEVAPTLVEAVAEARRARHCGFVVDVTMAYDDHGIAFLRELRRIDDHRFAIAISGSPDRELPARCYEAGAHGYVAKSRTLIRELRSLLPRLASIGAVLQSLRDRTDGIALPQKSFRFGGALIDPAHMNAQFGAHRAELYPKEIGILHLLSRRSGTLVRRSEILAEIWGPNANPTSKSLDTYMTRLRSMYARAGVDFRTFVQPKSKVGWRVIQS